MHPSKTLSSLAVLGAAVMSVTIVPVWLGCADQTVSLGQGQDAVGQGGDGGTGGTGATSSTSTWNIDQTGCPEDWAPLFEPNPPSCQHPTELPCYWQLTDGWVACSCGCDTPWHWACYSNMVQPGCPLTAPQQGSACVGSEGFSCPYFPDTRCQCDPYEAVWVCDLDFVVADGANYPCFDPTP